MSRPQRRARERQLIKQAKQIKRPGYQPTQDPEFRTGVARIVCSIDFNVPDGISGGHCIFRALTALEVCKRLKLPAQLEVGGMLYRVGPDPATWWRSAARAMPAW
jgi:hypothetical protein